jgi:hypothetical protein
MGQKLPSNFSINLGFLGGYNLNPEWAKRIGFCDRRSWMTLFQGLMVLGGIALLIIIVIGFVKGDSVKPDDTPERFPGGGPGGDFSN